MAVWRRDGAEQLRDVYKDLSLRDRFAKDEWSGPIEDPFTGKSLKVLIRLSDRESFFGRPISTTKQRFIVVLAKWPDGRRVCKVVEIPEGRVSKEMTVSLP